MFQISSFSMLLAAVAVFVPVLIPKPPTRPKTGFQTLKDAGKHLQNIGIFAWDWFKYEGI